jgi:hypothetical protein
MTIKHVQQLADMVGGKIESAGVAPDGSGFATMSMPLPKDHWIYAKDAKGWSLPPPMPFRMSANDPMRREWSAKVREAAKYAVRGATMGGTSMDFDPDALLQNLIVGMFGYHTEDGLSSDECENPQPVPPPFR